MTLSPVPAGLLPTVAKARAITAPALTTIMVACLGVAGEGRERAGRDDEPRDELAMEHV